MGKYIFFEYQQFFSFYGKFNKLDTAVHHRNNGHMAMPLVLLID